ncbi:MAG: hypothetical protein OQJ89_11980 [Kangiellaceae bacterium]|nr:hypothetical protein [Kangiellaceae bacterium]MCW9017679.1 hypothetical protein [Kangiellaceae bacterium]
MMFKSFYLVALAALSWSSVESTKKTITAEQPKPTNVKDTVVRSGPCAPYPECLYVDPPKKQEVQKVQESQEKD